MSTITRLFSEHIRTRRRSLDVSFTVQCLGRFGLAYLLSSNRTIRDGGSVISIGSPGVALSDIDLEDLSLKKRYEGGRFWPSLLVDQGKRDSMTLDAVTEVRLLLSTQLGRTLISVTSLTGTQPAVPQHQLLSHLSRCARVARTVGTLLNVCFRAQAWSPQTASPTEGFRSHFPSSAQSLGR